MKIFIIVLFLCPIMMLGQSHQSDVFSAGGGFSSAGDYVNFGVLGQPIAGIVVNSYTDKQGFIYTTDFPKPGEVWVNNDYCVTCPNSGKTWEYNAFSNMTHAIRDVALGGIVHASNAISGDDLNTNDYEVYIGNDDLDFSGTVSGDGYIVTKGAGYLSQDVPGDGSVVEFPIGTLDNRFLVEVTYTGGGNSEVKVRVDDALISDSGIIWYLEGPDNINATLTFVFPKSVFPYGFPEDHYFLRENETEWVEYDYLVNENSESYIVIVTGVNEF